MRVNENSWLIKTPIAHRGLWDENVVENTLSAYENAGKLGYAIEIDIFLTTDGQLVSFHDEDLERMTGVRGKVFQKSLAQLKALNLSDTTQKIPTFDEVLAVCENKVPILIEIKNQPNKMVVDKIIERLRSYKGEFALQSFNPIFVNRIKKLAPEFLRGILSDSTYCHKNKFVQFIVRKMPLNFLIKPNFLTVRHPALPLKANKRKNLPVIAWTVDSLQLAQKIKPYADNIIFENFILN